MINTDRGKVPFGEIGRGLIHEVVEQMHPVPSTASSLPAATPKPARSTAGGPRAVVTSGGQPADGLLPHI